MKYRYLAIALLMGATYARAQVATNLTGSPEAQGTLVLEVIAADNTLAAVPAVATNVLLSVPPPPYGGSGRKWTLSGSYEIGYVGSTSEKNKVSGSGYGFGFKIEEGVKFLMPTNSEAKYNFLSVSVFYTNFYTKESYKLAGVDSKTKYSVSMFGLPLSYCSISNRQNTGYFWQVGVNIGSPGVQTDNKNGINVFNKLYVEPSVYGGFSFWVERKRGVGAILLGPYVSYGVTNLANDGDASMHLLAVGIKYTGVLL